MKLENIKGTFDYSKKEQEIREYIKDTLKSIFKRYGYSPLETPILCYYDLLALKYDKDDEILKEIYKATDQGKRNLGLRYDLTVPFAKFIVMKKDLRLPFKKYEIGEAFRDGPVKLGRNRQFVQCDVDVVGLEGQVIEAELISLFVKGFNKFNIPIEIKYNSRNIMQGLIEELDIADIDTSNIIKVIDKMEKISGDPFMQELDILGIDSNKQKTLMEYFSMNFNELLIKFKDSNNSTLVKGINEIKALNELLDYQNLGKYMEFTPTLARGQEYYTGNVFEVYALNSNVKCSIGSGGRYDNLITNWIGDGNKYPAVGISFGLDVIYEVLKEKGDLKDINFINIYIIPINTYKETLDIADKIRDLGLNVEIEMKKIKIKKCFEYANKENIPFVIVIGEDELINKIIKIRNMETGIETSTPLCYLNEIKNIVLDKDNI